MQCKAFSRRNQARCRNPAMRGQEVCRMHGGKTPRGPASPNFKHGRYSRFLPSRLFAAYKTAARDPQLLELRQDIALIDARIIDVLTRVDTGEAGSIWREAQAAIARFRGAQAKGHIDAMQLAVAQVERLITKGAGNDAAWEEIGHLIEQRRKLVESEQRRLMAAQAMLSVDEAMTLVAQIVDIITTHVSDREALKGVMSGLQALGARNGHHQGPHDDDTGVAP